MQLLRSALVAAALLALPGCGGDDDGADDERPAVQRALAGWNEALRTADYRRACSLMTSDGWATITQDLTPEGCAAGFEHAYSLTEDDPVPPPPRVPASEVRVTALDGDRAKARLPGEGDYGLVRADGGWRVDARPAP